MVTSSSNLPVNEELELNEYGMVLSLSGFSTLFALAPSAQATYVGSWDNVAIGTELSFWIDDENAVCLGGEVIALVVKVTGCRRGRNSKEDDPEQTEWIIFEADVLRRTGKRSELAKQTPKISGILFHEQCAVIFDEMPGI